MTLVAGRMKTRTASLCLGILATGMMSWSGAAQAQQRNVIIFVVDGLRHGSVNPVASPTLYGIRQRGVHFTNSHSLFPTFTTPNASAIATGHYLGDTSDFSNTVFSGYPVFGGTTTPFLESNPVLADVDDHFFGNYLSEESLMAYARQHGYNTASVGKVGPVLIQDVTQGNKVGGVVPVPDTVIIDDTTGRTGGLPLSGAISTALTNAGLPSIAPDRTNGAASTSQQSNGFSGNNITPGTLAANLVQQQYFADATTKAILPTFKSNGKPFVLLFWSRDADGTQHNQGDSLNVLTPGINGPTSKASIANADNNLKQILDYVNSDPALAANTDIFVTADHGFSTISRHDADPSGTPLKSYAAGFIYKDATGRQEVNTGFLPAGFLAIDLAHFLNLPLFDPDNQVTKNGVPSYKPVDPTIGQATAAISQRPASGNGLIGGTGQITPSTDASVIIAANGGSDLIYVRNNDRTTIKNIVDFLTKQDYISGLYVNDNAGSVPGTLSLSAIGLFGSSALPAPSIVVNFRSFSTDPKDPFQTGVEVADSTLQQGQGMHGNFGRQDTFNNIAAIGPDFKTGFTDDAPISNADVQVTLAHILGFQIPSNGNLIGRVIFEALKGGPDKVTTTVGTLRSEPAANGQRTLLKYQQVGKTRYFDVSGFAGRAVGL